MAEKEYIERETALSFVLNAAGDWAASYSELQKYPAADVAPVKHGKWRISKNEVLPTNRFVCSECNGLVIVSTYRNRCLYNYCPNCGAKLDV